MKKKFFGLSDKDKTEIVSEAARNANFTQWFKMRIYEKTEYFSKFNEQILDELAIEIIDYLK